MRKRPDHRFCLAGAGFGALALLAACTATDVAKPSLVRTPNLAQSACLDLFARVDATIAAAGVGDAQAARLPDFPYLRIDRFLASFAGSVTEPPAWQAWLSHMRQLDRDARRIELANLPATSDLAAMASETERCADLLLAADMVDAATRQLLADQARVADAYDDQARWLGLYPLTALPVALGYELWKSNNLTVFAQSAAELPVSGHLVEYQPPAAGEMPVADIAALFETAPRDALGVPIFTAAERAALVAALAPVWVVDQVRDDDRIGAPVWRHHNIEVDTGEPQTFFHFSHARLGADVLVQVSYMIWFPARTAEPGLDLTGGKLDSVIWRVTLDAAGRPAVYDTIHGCGCYHLFFPVAPLRARGNRLPADISERAEAPAFAPRLAAGQRMTVRLSAGAHYVQSVAASPPASERHYALAPYDALRSLPAADARRSLFGPDGLVAGSERRERWVLWPMGVASAGAMRQWGHHATAFVGRRHFDDPWLMQDNFTFASLIGRP